jgi:hypothetical protein
MKRLSVIPGLVSGLDAGGKSQFLSSLVALAKANKGEALNFANTNTEIRRKEFQNESSSFSITSIQNFCCCAAVDGVAFDFDFRRADCLVDRW